MTRLIALLGSFLFVTVYVAGQPDPAARQKITILDCYRLAEVNYPQIRQYDLIDQTAHYSLSNLSKGWIPQLAVNAKASYQSEVTKLPFNTELFSSLMPGVQIPNPSKDQYQFTAEVSQHIWDGGQIHTNWLITKAQTEVDRIQTETDLYAIHERINTFFFGSLLQEELLHQNAILQQDLELNIERIRQRMANGVANQSDLDNMQVELLNARQQAVEQEAARKAYLQMLSVLTGLQELQTSQLQKPELTGRPLSPVVNRPELALFTAREQLIAAQDKQTTTSLMPRINAFLQGGYGRPGLDMLTNGFHTYYVAGVRLSWNLGTFYTLKDERRKNSISRRMVDVQRETFLFNTQLRLIQQNEEIAKWHELQRSDQEIIRLRTAVKSAAEVQLENGVISTIDLIREINAEHQARQTAAWHQIMQLQALYNYIYTTNNPE